MSVLLKTAVLCLPILAAILGVVVPKPEHIRLWFVSMWVVYGLAAGALTYVSQVAAEQGIVPADVEKGEAALLALSR